MARAIDVAAYILAQKGEMTAMKLQKLVYYSQAWHLVWEEKPLFAERIEAWANGPVTPELYNIHRGSFRLVNIGGNAGALTDDERSSVDAVLRHYGEMTAQHLSDLTHLEDPWKNTRGDLPSGAVCNREITLAAMAEYYSGL